MEPAMPPARSSRRRTVLHAALLVPLPCLGPLLIHGGRRDEGLAEMRRAVEASPAWAITHSWYAIGLRQCDDAPGALAESLKAAELDLRNLDDQYLAAWEVQLAGRAAESLPFIERIATLQPDKDLTGFLRAYALQRNGRWSAAEAACRDFLARHPTHAGSWFNLGCGLAEAGRKDEARAAFEETLRQEPGHAAAAAWIEALAGSAPAPSGSGGSP